MSIYTDGSGVSAAEKENAQVNIIKMDEGDVYNNKRSKADVETETAVNHTTGLPMDHPDKMLELKCQVKNLTKRLRLFEKVLTCPVCQVYFCKPFTFKCGHSVCALCIRDCLKSRMDKDLERECPVCREVIIDEPALSYALQSQFDSLVENLPDNEEKDYILQRLENASELVNSIEWKTYFPTETIMRNFVYDQSDRVYRCGSCNGEIAAGKCTLCSCVFDELLELTQDNTDIDDYEDDDELDEEEGEEAVEEGEEEYVEDDWDEEDSNFIDDQPLDQEEYGSNISLQLDNIGVYYESGNDDDGEEEEEEDYNNESEQNVEDNEDMDDGGSDGQEYEEEENGELVIDGGGEDGDNDVIDCDDDDSCDDVVEIDQDEIVVEEHGEESDA